jgi:AraC family transcriptional regulator
MNFYVALSNQVVDFIEENIHQDLPLETLAREFGFSGFHFNRIFRTVSGRTLKQYILGRKLSLAMEKLEVGAESVIDIAYDFGFNSPEVFSRAFKHQFGISPNFFRKERPQLEAVSRPCIVERDIVNFQGQLALRGDEICLGEIPLEGVQVDVNVTRPGFERTLASTSDGFYRNAVASGDFAPEPFYALVNCQGDEDSGNYRVFYGLQANPIVEHPHPSLTTRSIPPGWYEKFLYTGDMFEIRLSFINDLYRWVIVNEIELEANGIGMLNIFKADYPQTQQVEILVPIKHG